MKRYLYHEILKLALRRNKMAFVSGPRQVGKTTLSKSYTEDFDQVVYRNWDESAFRKQWTKDPAGVVGDIPLEKSNQIRLLILDEVHKSKNWKQKVKGPFDVHGTEINILVTGSARLNVFKNGGDSLMGRYFNFRLHPLSYGELLKQGVWSQAWLRALNKQAPKVF